EWLEDFLAEQSVAYDRLVLGGFSQGGVMSYALGLGKGGPRRAALPVFSSFIPRVNGFGFDLSPPLPPVAIGHGTLDPVIGVEWGRQAREVLEAAGGARGGGCGGAVSRDTDGPPDRPVVRRRGGRVAARDHSASRMKAANRLRAMSR